MKNNFFKGISIIEILVILAGLGIGSHPDCCASRHQTSPGAFCDVVGAAARDSHFTCRLLCGVR